MLRIIPAPSLLLLSITLSIPAAEPEWKVGIAQAKIIPERPVALAGCAARTKPFERVAVDLFVKALVLEDRGGQRGVMVTSDLLGFAASVAEPICKRIAQKTGLKRSQILLNSSHSHSGPAPSLKVPAKDAANSCEALRTVEYTKQLQEKVVAVVEEAAAVWNTRRLQIGLFGIHTAAARGAGQ